MLKAPAFYLRIEKIVKEGLELRHIHASIPALSTASGLLQTGPIALVRRTTVAIEGDKQDFAPKAIRARPVQPSEAAAAFRAGSGTIMLRAKIAPANAPDDKNQGRDCK